MIELCPPCSARNVRESGSNARWPNRLCSPSIDFRWLQVLPRLADLNIGDAQHLYCQASAFWPVNELKLGMRMHFRVERLCLGPSDCSNLTSRARTNRKPTTSLSPNLPASPELL